MNRRDFVILYQALQPEKPQLVEQFAVNVFNAFGTLHTLINLLFKLV